jgi:hypothetical protein
LHGQVREYNTGGMQVQIYKDVAEFERAARDKISRTIRLFDADSIKVCGWPK